MNLFLTSNRKEIINVDGINIEFRYPTLADEIQIESKKILITRGQYATIALTSTMIDSPVMEMVDAIATLSIVSSFPDNPENLWENIIDSDGKEFLEKVYKSFKEWRLSFREQKPEQSIE